MNDYISTKTVFINKLYDKFHKKNMEQRILDFNRKKYQDYFTNLGAYILFKYKYYIFEAPQNIAEEIFWRFLKNKPIEKENFFKNFHIESYEDKESLECKKNTNETVYINKYQILFFYFWVRSMFIFQKIDNREQKLMDDFFEKIF